LFVFSKMAVHAPYGIVLTVIFGIASIVGTIMIYLKRNHTFIRCRNPFFLIVQNIGTLTAATITSLYLGLRPDFSCYAYEIGASMPFAGLALPMAVRCWEYCVNFHISKVRSKFRSNVLLPNWGEASWFFRNRWVAGPRFMMKFFFLVDWIWFLPTIPFFLQKGQYDYNQKTNSCSSSFSGGTEVTVVMVLIFVFLAIFLGILMRGSRDAYRIKNEISIIAFSWLFVIILWIPFSLSTNLSAKFPPNIWLLIGFYWTFCWCTIFPLVLAYRHDQLDVGEATSGFKEFIEKLENLHFRNAFHDFLALQFCQENILFYEVVMDWKRLPVGDSTRNANAKFINENYILESGVCQVNISGPTRERINLAVNKLEALPEDLFDEALAAVLNVMHANSYYQFKSHRLYQKAKV